MIVNLTRFLCAGLALGLAACGDSHDDDPDPDAEACEHLQEGPFHDRTAGADADDSAPQIAADHAAYRVTIPAGGGFVRFAAPAAGDHGFYLSEAVAVTFRDGAGTPIAPEETLTSIAACQEVAVKHVVELAVGTVFLELADDAARVDLVVEPLDHEH
jgi:hypothetical protein